MKKYKMTEEHKRNISNALMGRTLSKETRDKIGRSNSGENSAEWKGDNVGLSALHSWVAKILGKPRKCEFCGTTTAKRYEWANVSGKYKRDISDWIRLCKHCHMAFDGHYPPTRKGTKASEETKIKMSIGVKKSYENREVWSKGRKGVFSKEAIEKMRAARLRNVEIERKKKEVVSND